jgi:Fur family ferric uptake transcriptional regulator
MKDINELKSLLKSKHLRVTNSRIAVGTILFKNIKMPLTSEEIFTKIQKSKKYDCDQVSVYRILSIFEEIGLIKKSVFQGEASRYLLSDSKTNTTHPHEHYFKCTNCNYIKPFHNCFVSTKEKELEKSGFKDLKHHLEITGLCPNCAEAS